MSSHTAHATGRNSGAVGAAPVSNAIAFDGSSLNVDYAAYLSQHDVVHHAPAQQGRDALAIGDGDMGGMLWCPGCLRMQVQKSDLWADPSARPANGAPGPASNWRQISAGAVSLYSSPSILENPRKFEQRLSLYSGVMTLNSETEHGACQITAFAAASAGVFVIHYQDQSLRSAQRWVDVSLWRDAHLFALGENIGIIQALADRRYALMARIGDRAVTPRMVDRRTARLEIEPFRSGSFTLYLTVATSGKTGDPMALAKTRIADAQARGMAELLREHREHWGQFWQKSFLRLEGPPHDPLPGYLENLWYLTLYHLAAASRGHDAPLPDGALWLPDGDTRARPAIYEGAALRQMYAPLLPANHLELTAPYLSLCQNLLPRMAAEASQQGMAGAQFPARFNHFGEAFPRDTAGASATSAPSDRETAYCEGLEHALFFWESWRHAPDPSILQAHVYPLLRASVMYALDFTAAKPETLAASPTQTLMSAGLRALLWASRHLEQDEDARPHWQKRLDALAKSDAPDSHSLLQPYGALDPLEAAAYLSDRVTEAAPWTQGLFSGSAPTPDLAAASRLSAGLMALLLREEPGTQKDTKPADTIPSGILRVFGSLPPGWNAAFSLAAPGGLRISAEASRGRARYVAVQSLTDGPCRLANPWGAGKVARLRDGRHLVSESADAVLEFEVRPGVTYTLDSEEFPLFRAARARMSGRRNEKPKRLGDYSLGLIRKNN